MRAAIIIVLLVAAAASSAFASSNLGLGWRKPGFCGHLDCPEYSVWQRNFDFEVREYREAAWVAMNVSGLHYQQAIKTATPVLSKYFWGANKEGLRLKETVPLVVNYRLDVHPHTGQRRNFTIFWFLPYIYHAQPPEPTEPGVFIFRNPSGTMFVRMFLHRAHEWRVVKESRELIAALNHAGHEYEPGAVLAAAYSHPGRPGRHRHGHRYHHSEVWVHGTFNKTGVSPELS